MMRQRVSFFNASDGTAIGNLENLELPHIPAVGTRVVFAGGFNNDGWPYRVSHIEHVVLFDDDMQIVDVYLSKADPFKHRPDEL